MHTDATSVADTDWGQVVRLYDQLDGHRSHAGRRAQRAVAVAETDGPAAALGIVDGLDLTAFHAFHAVRADLLGAPRPGRGGRHGVRSRPGAHRQRAGAALPGEAGGRAAAAAVTPSGTDLGQPVAVCRAGAKGAHAAHRASRHADSRDADPIRRNIDRLGSLSREILRHRSPEVGETHREPLSARPVRRGPQHGLDARPRARPCSEPGEPCRRGVHAGGRDADPTGFTVAVNRDAIGPGALDQADVLVIAHPAAHGTERLERARLPRSRGRRARRHRGVRARGRRPRRPRRVRPGRLRQQPHRAARPVRRRRRQHHRPGPCPAAQRCLHLGTRRPAHRPRRPQRPERRVDRLLLPCRCPRRQRRAGRRRPRPQQRHRSPGRGAACRRPRGRAGAGRGVRRLRPVRRRLHPRVRPRSLVGQRGDVGRRLRRRDIGPWWGGVGQGRGRLGERGGGRDPQRGRRR